MKSRLVLTLTAITLLSDGCHTTSVTSARKVRITFSVREIVEFYPISTYSLPTEKRGLSEPRSGTTTAIILQDVGGVKPPPDGHCIAFVTSDLVAAREFKPGDMYEVELYDSYLDRMYIPFPPKSPWEKTMSDVRRVI